MEPSARRSFHIGRYHCVEALSQGPLGETFRAKVYGVAGLEKQYALKQIDAALRVDPEVRAVLVDAARAYASLEHERIARLTEIHDEAESLFLVIELARGIDLPRLALHLRGRGESLPVDQAILISVDIAEALAAAHQSRGVLHRGLHPGAIAVLAEGEARVGDFAIAAAIERPGYAEDQALLPLLAYTAPERRAGASAAPSADVWSVGAILFELCTGEPWIGVRSVAELASFRAEPARYAKVPSRPGLRELLERMLADDPQQRPQTAEVLREALAALLGLELGRARAGLQALVKRALGRALTRTGSFAAVGMPSVSMPTLVAEAPGATTHGSLAISTGPRTLLGVATAAPRAQPVSAIPPVRAWAPPRATGIVPVPLAAADETGPTQVGSLNGLGEPPQMEMAELPPSAPPPDGSPGEVPAPDLHDVTITERSMSSVGFDDGVTAPHGRYAEEELVDASTRPSLDPGSIELDFSEGATDVRDAPDRPRPPPPPPRPSTASFPALPPAPPRSPAPTESQRLAPLATAEQLTAQSDDAPVRSGVRLGLLLVAVLGVAVAAGVGLSIGKLGSTPPPQPKTEVAKPETPKTEVAKPETPKTEVAKPEIPKTEVVTQEVPKTEVAKLPSPAAGQLVVETTPPGATVWLDGENRGTTPLSTAITSGKHRVALALLGMRLVQKQLVVESDGAELSHSLEPALLPAKVAGEGGLKVRCRTVGELRILVDGYDTGITCPNDERIPVTPGIHKIGLVSPRSGDLHEVDGEIEADLDHSTRIYVRF